MQEEPLLNTQNKIDQDIYENLLFLLVDHISNKCQDDSLHKAEQAVCSYIRMIWKR